jgi:hypothetical protein
MRSGVSGAKAEESGGVFRMGSNEADTRAPLNDDELVDMSQARGLRIKWEGDCCAVTGTVSGNKDVSIGMWGS